MRTLLMPLSPVVALCLAGILSPDSAAHGFASGTQALAFVAGCELPFKDIATETTISGSCAIDGLGSAQSRLQNRAKNDFCAPGPAADITNTSFRNLQGKVETLPASFKWGTPTNLPPDRSPLADIYTTHGRPPSPTRAMLTSTSEPVISCAHIWWRTNSNGSSNAGAPSS